MQIKDKIIIIPRTKKTRLITQMIWKHIFDERPTNHTVKRIKASKLLEMQQNTNSHFSQFPTKKKSKFFKNSATFSQNQATMQATRPH